MSSTRVLVVSHDVVGRRMAGTGIRYWELARVLASEFPVCLAVPGRAELTGKGFDLVAYEPSRPESVQALLPGADVVLAYGYAIRRWPFLAELAVPWVADVYVPEPTEALAWYSDALPAKRQEHYDSVYRVLEPLAGAADFYLCGSEPQRDFWLGLLAAHGRLGPEQFAADPTLRSLVDLVPFGLPSRPAIHSRTVLKGVWPGVEADDRVILWGGGLWDWLDPLTLLRAMARVAESQPATRLVFPGTRHPNAAAVPEMAMRQRALDLARELGLAERHVFFGDWVEHADWQNYLLEADVGVSLHLDTIESHFAFRTRLLDYIWAGLPMVVSAGDSLAGLVAEHNLGQVVPAGDEEGVARALLSLLDDPDARLQRQPAFASLCQELTWEKTAEPLLQFCRQPHRSANKGIRSQTSRLAERVAAQEAELSDLRELLDRYRSGRFMRFMAAIARTKTRVLEGRWKKPTTTEG